VSTLGYPNGQCLQTGGTSSTMYNYPDYSVWSGNSNACLGVPTQQNAVMPTMCTPDADDGFIGYLGYQSWSSTSGSSSNFYSVSRGVIAGMIAVAMVALAC
jgi:hypothetical protein